MNSYGDSQSARARASVPGTSAATPDDEHRAAGRPAPDAYRRGAGGQASVSGAVPRGAVGETSGRVVGGTSGRVPVGAGAVAGRATVGSARVGARPVTEPGRGTRGAVARAAVRPPGYDVGGGSGPIQPPGAGVRGKDRDPSKAAKRRRRANIL